MLLQYRRCYRLHAAQAAACAHGAQTWPSPPNSHGPPARMRTVQEPRTWLAEHGPAELQHPMRDALFLGMDERGDLIPTRALRDKFRQPRQDIYPPDAGPADDAPSGPD